MHAELQYASAFHADSDHARRPRAALTRTGGLPSTVRARMLAMAKASPNLYGVLGLSPAARAPDIKAAFRRLAKASHPDFNTDDVTANTRFQVVHLAYRVLCDSDLRADYDSHLQLVCIANTAPVPAGARRRRLLREAVFIPILVIALTPLFVIGFKSDAVDRLVAIIAQWRAEPTPSRPTELPASVAVRLPDSAPPTQPDDRPPDQPPATPAAPELRPTAPAPAETGDLDQARRFLAQGERHVAQGNIAVAREYFVRAADLGLAIAATRMAETFDADALARYGVRGVKPDPAQAAQWHGRALDIETATTPAAVEARAREGAGR
jgi:curved DNA-binding protein CbpA